MYFENFFQKEIKYGVNLQNNSKNDILFIGRYGERVDTWLSKSHGAIRVGSNPTNGSQLFKDIEFILEY